MYSSPDVYFRLSIWKPASLNKSYLYRSGRDDQFNSFMPLQQSQVLEQIYSWNAGGHDVFGAAPPEMSKRIQDKLLEKFSFEHNPDQRTVALLFKEVSLLLQEPSLQTSSYWADTQESIPLDTEEELNLRANVALAVLLHLQWISHVFRQVPRASVLVR